MIPPNATGKAPRVLFVADAGPDVGGGHVMRCLTLAASLMDRGAACAFVAHEAARPILEAFAPAQVERIGGDGGLEQAALAAAAAWKPTVVVMDGYGLGAEAELSLGGEGRRVAVIDDLADRPHHCTLLADPGFGRSQTDYRALVPEGCTVLAGPRYALVRPEFSRNRAQALAGRGRPVHRILVSLGLTDVGAITARVLEEVLPAAKGCTFDVVLGSGAPSLRNLAKGPALDLHVDARDMAALMMAADLGIGAGGSSTWERACLALPSITLALAPNQRPMVVALDKAGAALAVDVADPDWGGQLRRAVSRLLDEPELRASLSRTSATLCDGEGARLVAEAILSG